MNPRPWAVTGAAGYLGSYVVDELLARGTPVLALDDLSTDMVPVADAARAIVAMLDAVPPGVTTANVATGVAVSMQEVLDAIGVLRGAPLPIETDPAKVRPSERPHLQADVAKLEALIGWSPSPDLRAKLTTLLRAEGLFA